MPELPDIAVYREALERRIVGRRLRSITIKSHFLLRTIDPPIDACEGRLIQSITTLGKRLVFTLHRAEAPPLFLVLHLMIAGRLLWKSAASRPVGQRSLRKIDVAAFAFEPERDDGSILVLTEASQLKRASLHVLASREQLHAMDPGGIDPLACSACQLAQVLRRENHTLKRSLTDPHTLSGIGNAYSDEILHAARLSPILLTSKITDAQVGALHAAMQSTLITRITRLRREFELLDDQGDSAPGRFPSVGDITAFRPDFAVHGKFGQPCPACGTKVARIVRTESEFNYCPTCQTNGKLLADRSLSRLLKDDWGKE